MAGLDGIQNKIVPPDPIDKDLYDLEPHERKEIQSTPGSLEEVLDALERITPSCSKAMCSRRTSSKHGWTTNGSRKLTRFVCDRIRTNSACTTTFNTRIAHGKTML